MDSRTNKVDIYIPPMLFKKLGLRASDTLLTLHQRVMARVNTYPLTDERSHTFRRTRLAILDPRPRDADGRLLLENGMSSSAAGNNIDAVVSATSPKRTAKVAATTTIDVSGKGGGGGGKGKKKKKTAVKARARPLTDLHSSLWTLKLDSARQLTARWEERATGSAATAADGLRDGRQDGSLIYAVSYTHLTLPTIYSV